MITDISLVNGMVYIVNGARLLLDVFINIISELAVLSASIRSGRGIVGSDCVYFIFEKV